MKHMMNILDQTGHTSIGWDSDSQEEVAIAREAFNKAIERGYHAFRVTERDGGERRGERMQNFDPTAERMMLMPQLRGG